MIINLETKVYLTISINSNFFDLGGHSLLAVKLFAQIQQKLNKDLPLASLFQSPTIEELANIIRQKGVATDKIQFDG